MKCELSNHKTVQKRKKISIDQIQLFVMSIPIIVALIIFCYIPMFGVVIAFKDFKINQGILGSAWVGFKNFAFFFQSSDCWRVVRNTLLYNTAFIILNTFFSVSFAIALSYMTKKGLLRFYQSAMFLPYFLSWVIVSFMALTFLNYNNGIFNVVLRKMGIEPISWYNTPKYWPVILIFFNVWKGAGYNSLIYYSAILGIDASLYESAEIDGCTSVKKIQYITLPLLKPVMITLILLAIGSIFRADFGLFYQLPLNSGSLINVTDVVDTYIYRTFRVTGNAGISSAVGLCQSVIGLVLVSISNAVANRVEEGSGIL